MVQAIAHPPPCGSCTGRLWGLAWRCRARRVVVRLGRGTQHQAWGGAKRCRACCTGRRSWRHMAYLRCGREPPACACTKQGFKAATATLSGPGGPYNFRHMLRRFSRFDPPLSACEGVLLGLILRFWRPGARMDAREPRLPRQHGGAFDADDHALMDDKGDLPDQLEPHALASAGAVHSVDSVPHPVNRSLSAVVDPPHKPPKT